ncbi:MAG: hypothetical protein AB1491_03495 [Thermodesulfobacteriota bacterium]
MARHEPLETQEDKAVAVNGEESPGCESRIEACPAGAITVTEV